LSLPVQTRIFADETIDDVHVAQYKVHGAERQHVNVFVQRGEGADPTVPDPEPKQEVV
jgi:hypothetical protein